MMSKAAKKVLQLLQKAFPSYRINQEHYVLYQNTRLLFDFYLPELKVLIEVQGEQHFTFNSFHYYSKNNLTDQILRDKLKTQWVDELELKLLVLNEEDIKSLTLKSLRDLIVNLV